MSAGEISDNELDAFDSRNEQILLDQAGEYMGANYSEEDSEEEVLGLKNQNPDDLDDDNGSESEENASGDEDAEQEEQLERWESKREYYGGDDMSDDDAGEEMAQEALRQQRKHLQELQMDDFVDEEVMQDWQKSAAKFDLQEPGLGGAVVEEETVDFNSLDDDEKLKHLQGKFPEFVPLLTEFTSLTPQLETLRNSRSNELLHAKFVALSAYLASISSYFSIFVEKLQKNHTFSMKDNPVMESILSTREVWRQAKELTDDTGKDDAKMAEDSSMDEFADAAEEIEPVTEDRNEERLQTDSEEDSESDGDDESSSSGDENSGSNGINIDISAKRSIRKPKAVPSGDYIETSMPDTVDREEKDRRKKSLRFYTSKIDQAAKKNAQNEKFDGDADLPYRERLFERQQRLVEEARKKGLGKDKAQLGQDLDGEDYASGDEHMAKEINDDAASYYDLIKLGKVALKEARRMAHEQAKKAARAGKLAELAESADEHGKRALNFQIMKNKGLTPNRRNDNRNARVKKRKRYDQAQKKLKSVRQVYDESNKGPYQGEKTGIKKNLSRSVKLQ